MRADDPAKIGPRFEMCEVGVMSSNMSLTQIVVNTGQSFNFILECGKWSIKPPSQFAFSLKFAQKLRTYSVDVYIQKSLNGSIWYYVPNIILNSGSTVSIVIGIHFVTACVKDASVCDIN
jgi:hypothetical protein